MGTSATPPANAQRARTKAPDLSELFRSAHGSRHSLRTGADAGSSPNLSPAGKSAGTKAPSRRSMLPFLGRKKPELPAAPTTSMPRKSVTTIHSVPPVNTVRRSFGNGHAVLMITPAMNGFPSEPPLPSPSELSSADAHPPSFGSKLVAHFTPSRSPSRGSRVRYPTAQKSAPPSPPIPSPIILSPPVPEIRAPSIDSHHSGIQSRSATPRPLHVPYSPAAQNGYEEDFSDLFTFPDKVKIPQSPLSPRLGDAPKMSGELTPTVSTSSGPPLQFPIPPSTIVPPRPVLMEKGARYSSELMSLSSQGSRSPSKRRSPLVVDGGSTPSLYSDFSSHDERRSTRYRTASFSGSDTDTSRANDSTYSTSSFRLAPASPKCSRMKPKPSATCAANVSSGPPPSLPLPSPPHNSSNSSGLGPRSAPISSPSRMAFPRPRANTLSVTSNPPAPGYAVPRLAHPSPPRSARANSDVTPDGTADELRETLAQQRRKNAQLQEYIVTITKRYEDDHAAMRRTIEKLERNIRKRTREIEGLRWLVIHNGAASDIDAAANLARSSLSTQESYASDAIRGPSSNPMASPQHNGSRIYQMGSEGQGTNATVAARTSTSDVRSDTPNAAPSLSIHSASESAPSTAPSRSITPKRIDGAPRTDRQKSKEERRASKALRRISAVSNLALADPLIQSPSTDGPLDPNFDPKQSMDEVLEKLQPFRHT